MAIPTSRSAGGASGGPALRSTVGIVLALGGLYGVFRTWLALQRVTATDTGVYAVRLLFQRGFTTALILVAAAIVWSRRNDAPRPYVDAARAHAAEAIAAISVFLAWGVLYQYASPRYAELIAGLGDASSDAWMGIALGAAAVLLLVAARAAWRMRSRALGQPR